eukprot:m.47757 g.47757  ORF g.47757 m.47757 type:complete len:252 (+) comp17694_c0_seq1:76-831(+)
MVEAEKKEKKTWGEAWAEFRHYAHNKDDGTRCGRDGTSWRNIILFYFIFYGLLTCLFAICYAAMFESLPDRDTSPELVRLNTPSLNIFPRTISYDHERPETYAPIVEAIRQYIIDQKWQDLDFPEPCKFSETTNFGYDSETPCVYLRLNRVADRRIPQDATTYCEVDFGSVIPGQPNPERLGTGSPNLLASGYPYRNSPDFVNQGSAVAIDLTAVSGNTGFRMGCQADYGQKLRDEEDGFFDRDIRVLNLP